MNFTFRSSRVERLALQIAACFGGMENSTFLHGQPCCFSSFRGSFLVLVSLHDTSADTFVEPGGEEEEKAEAEKDAQKVEPHRKKNFHFRRLLVSSSLYVVYGRHKFPSSVTERFGCG